YKLPVGLLRVGDPADFIIVDNLKDFNVQQTFIDGVCVAERGQSLLPFLPPAPINRFYLQPITSESLQIAASATPGKIRVIEAMEGQLVTRELILPAKVVNGKLVSDTGNDILKLVVINRYEPAPIPAIAFVKGFGLKRGAIASTVAHDCHNIIAAGVSDEDIARAVNLLVASQGGISVVDATNERVLPLPVAGLMSDQEGSWVAGEYALLDRMAKELGSELAAPFMTLSFMALLVIPDLKLSDKGLFSGQSFSFTGLEVTE
ncbi:MAG: adenine deaminase, partial [Sphingobacteriales bacterium]